jgi:hypothetical protein
MRRPHGARERSQAMKYAGWSYELPATGAASEGLEDYEARDAEGEHVGVVVGLVRRAEEMFVLVDAGAMPPFIHRRLAVRWEDVAAVDHAALVVQLAVDRAGLEEAALGLDPKNAVHGRGAEAARTPLPVALTGSVPAGTEGPVERGSAVVMAALAAAAPFSLFVLVALWIARGLSGWEYALLGLPFVLAALTVALAGYRLYREPHLGRGRRGHGAVAPRRSRRRAAFGRWLGGKGELVLFAVGGGVLYLTMLLAVTVALGEGLPLLGWIGFAVAATVVLAASTMLAVFLVRSSTGAGAAAPQRRPQPTAGHRVLVVADAGCSGEALCRPLAERLLGCRAEVLVVAPALVSGVHYLDSDVDAARRAAQTRVAETVAAFEAEGISARGEVGSESPLEAIADALTVFAADEIVVATPPPERTNWLEENVVERARGLYEQPLSHLVVDAAAPLEPRPR